MGASRGKNSLRGNAFGRSSIPMPILPKEAIGMMSGSMRKKRGGRRDERGSKQTGVRLPDGRIQSVSREEMNNMRGKKGFSRIFDMRLMPKETYREAPDQPRGGGDIGIGGGPGIPPRFPRGNRENQRRRRGGGDIGIGGGPGIPPRFPRRRRVDPNKPSAVMETERVNVQDPTLGGPPEREVPIPRERDTSPRGQAPFSPDERAMARDAFFEKMFSRADERKQQKAMRKEERMNTIQSMRDEDRNTAVDRRRGEIDTGGEINLDAERGGRRKRSMRDEKGGRRRRRMRRRDFTRRRSRMEGRRSREERAAFRDRFVSTLR